MLFKKYARKAISYEKQMQIEENKEKVEKTLDCIRMHLPYAISCNVETDSLYREIVSVADRSPKNNYLVNPQYGAKTEAQKKMMDNIDSIVFNAQKGIKMNFIVDMKSRKYISACKDEDIGVCLCCLYPVNASKPIILLTDENQPLELYAYVGVQSREGVAYVYVKDVKGSLIIELQEFHFLSLRKDPVYNYDHGLLLSYNPEWGWQNISFSIILKENQNMVRELFDSVRNPMKSIEQSDSDKMNMKTANHLCPWQ